MKGHIYTPASKLEHLRVRRLVVVQPDQPPQGQGVELAFDPAGRLVAPRQQRRDMHGRHGMEDGTVALEAERDQGLMVRLLLGFSAPMVPQADPVVRLVVYRVEASLPVAVQRQDDIVVPVQSDDDHGPELGVDAAVPAVAEMADVGDAGQVVVLLVQRRIDARTWRGNLEL